MRRVHADARRLVYHEDACVHMHTLFSQVRFVARGDGAVDAAEAEAAAAAPAEAPAEAPAVEVAGLKAVGFSSDGCVKSVR